MTDYDRDSYGRFTARCPHCEWIGAFQTLAEASRAGLAHSEECEKA